MRLLLTSLALLAAGQPACKSVDCGVGTIERAGTCQPADETTSTAKCGAFTMLVGDQCVPMFPPTLCDPGTTMADTDPATGVTTCLGTGGGGCSAAFACPQPASGKQTICGQLYNFADNTKFAAPGATGAQCTTPTTSGPCALQVAAFDAVVYAGAPTTTSPQSTGPIYIDDCGRYRIPDITVPANPYIALGWDDAGMPFGPAGVTVTTGVAVPSQPDGRVKDLEAWIVDMTTVGTWQATGGPMLANGIYSGIFRTHMCDPVSGMCTGDGFQNQMGVTFTKNGSTASTMPNDYYFQAGEATRLHVDSNASATSVNGTVLYMNAAIGDGLAYSGNTGGIVDTANCQWEQHAAAVIPGVVFMQVYRPTNKLGKTCTQ